MTGSGREDLKEKVLCANNLVEYQPGRSEPDDRF